MLRWALLLGAAALACRESPKPKPEPTPEPAPAPAADAAASHAPEPADPAARIARYLAAVDQACDSGVTSSCWYQGIVYRRGLLGVKADEPRAREYFERGCNDKLRGPGCPEVFAAKKKLTTAEREAVDWWCAQGRPDACAQSLDPQHSYHLCNTGRFEACLEQRPLASDAKPGEPETPALPASADERARAAAAHCDKNRSFGCATLAAAYLEGTHGLAVDRDRAFALGMRSCDRNGSILGCYPAAAARLAAAGDRESVTAIMLLAKQGCDRGHMPACVEIARAMDRMDDIKMRQQALGYWLRACYLGGDRAIDACADFERAVPRAVE
jgi:TPR repeat protein